MTTAPHTEIQEVLNAAGRPDITPIQVVGSNSYWVAIYKVGDTYSATVVNKPNCMEPGALANMVGTGYATPTEASKASKTYIHRKERNCVC
jgi:hypothetical protein